MDSRILPSASFWLTAGVLAIAYFLVLAVYRLTLDPLSKFPGDKFAAITRYYEGYYDVVKGGQYTFKIEQMHRIYGPIIRISPYELHINDPTFFNYLYRQEAAYDKNHWSMKAFPNPGASLVTTRHDLHKVRRRPLSPFFSKAKATEQEELYLHHETKLFDRLDHFVSTKETFDFGWVISAYIRDVTNEFILGKSYHSLDRQDFDKGLLVSGLGWGKIWHLAKFIPVILPLLNMLPMSMADDDMRTYLQWTEECRKDIGNLIEEVKLGEGDETSPRTLVHAVLESKLPASEKEFQRVFEDVHSAIGGAMETTANALRLIFFHVYDDPQILKRLRAELSAARAAGGPLRLKALEQIPYLTAIIMEGLRLSPGISTRTARVSPDADILYDQYCIPAGTAVGMTTILMHTDEALFPKPMSFTPERFIENGEVKRMDRGYAPFSKGTRVCLGQHLAWALMHINLADIVQRYDLHIQDASAEDFACTSDQFIIGTKSKGSLKVSISACRHVA